MTDQAASFLTPKEVAHILRLNILTVYEFIKNGQLVGAKFGRAYRISVAELNRFISDHLTRKK